MIKSPTKRLPMIRGLRSYLTPITSPTDRSRIYKNYREQLSQRGVTRTSPMNPLRREALHDAIFIVENEIESRGDGRPDDPRVLSLNTARNRIADDLGWND